MVVAGFILGIVSIVLSFFGTWLSIAALPLAIVGLILSVMGKKKNPSGLATAGVVIGIIAVVLTAIFFFTCGLCTIIAINAVA